MNKFLLFFFILPFFGFSQVDLVKWNGALLLPTPSLLVNNISAGNITASNVNFSTQLSGFETTQWPTSNTPDYTKYIELSISGNSGYKISLEKLKFEYLINSNGPATYDVRCSTVASFQSNVTTLMQNVQVGNNIAQVISLSGITVLPSTTIYIRIYAYNGNGNGAGNGAGNGRLTLSSGTTGPTFTGTVSCTNISSTPTNITGTTTLCSGDGGTTLTATGGTAATGSVYQWGIGNTIGVNPILGQISASITVNPLTTTTYWVRRIDTLCANNTTGGISQVITVNPGTTAGNLSTTTATICKNTKPNPITLSGHVGDVIRWESANDAAFTNGVTTITSTATTLTSNIMGAISATRYYRAVIQNGNCSVKNTSPIGIIIPAAITYINGLWDAIPSAASSIIISSNLTLTADMDVCSCQITNGVTVTVNSGTNLIVRTALTVDPTSNIIIEDKASLVQMDDEATNIGNITVKRKSAPMKLYDYTYWSSPVQNWKLNQLSPNTGYYYSFDPLTNNWAGTNGGNQVMTAGKGYIIRAPQGWSTTNATLGVYNGNFIGVPNTGIVPVTIKKGAGTFNLIGNPYPSAIDVDLFLSDPANSGIINGTIYIWTHNTAISSTIPGNATYNYTSDDYAKYNLTGGVKTALTSITGLVTPNGKIASGQGFFIEANTALANGAYTASFKNSMRITGNNNQFFRTAPAPQSVTNTIEKNRIWLNISNPQGAYNETLLGYVTGATNGFDNLYDGKTFPAGNVLSLYSVVGTDNYSIQGRALPFNASEIIPLGYSTTLSGTFSIAIENLDGFFTDQNVYLLDKSNNTTHNLKTSAYSFTTATGTFNNRFELRFTTATLGNDNPTLNENTVAIYPNDKQINIKSTMTMESVIIYDILGRQLFNANKINAMNFQTTDLTATNQVLIVKVKFADNNEVTKKVMMN